MIDHLAGDSGQQVLVGTVQELKEHFPRFAIGGVQAADGGFPALVVAAQALLHDVQPDPLGHGADEAAFLAQEGAFIGAGYFLGVADRDLAHLLPHHHDVGALLPLRRLELQGNAGAVHEGDHGATDFRVLPTGGENANQAVVDLLVRKVDLPQDLVNAVETVELLGALFQRRHDRVARSIGIQHGLPRLRWCWLGASIASWYAEFNRRGVLVTSGSAFAGRDHTATAPAVHP